MNSIPQGKTYQPQSLNAWMRRSFVGITPENLRSRLSAVERGDQVEDFADLVAFALRDDATLFGVEHTIRAHIAGAERVIEPGRGVEESLAEDAAEMCREALDRADTPSIVSWLLHAEFLGWASAQHRWTRKGAVWWSDPTPVQHRDLEFGTEWEVRLRTYKDNAGGAWLDLREQNPAQFLVHLPQKHDSPQLSGDFHAIAWAWLDKRWLGIFQQLALEKLGSPFIYGTVPPNATATVRQAMLEGLENMSSQHVAVFEDSSAINILETSGSPGQAFADAIDAKNAEMIKGILGSTLNVEIGESGGNRAAAESQSDMTIMPRLRAKAQRLARTIEKQWFSHQLRINSHVFGGRIPPVPTLSFKLHEDDPADVDQLVLEHGKVTHDELRVSRGLPALGPENGGDEFVVAARPAAPPDIFGGLPSFSAASATEGEQRLPLPGSTPPPPAQMNLQLSRTMPTSSASATQIASRLRGALAARGR